MSSERVFVDTSAYFALIDPRDQNHGTALSTFRRLTDEGSDLYTTTAVLQETHALIVNRLDRDTALRVIERLYASTTRIIRPTERDEREALETLRQQRDKAFGLVDAVSMAVMRRIHLRAIWTYDRHFSQAGFTQIG